ncbi:hypothetical protein [Herbiconiux liukaitaii]|uniref:hypothetical protein n=1 Tax=Herbiconiux liukaitaii TaxID=3342799 RepID=UPI0035B806A2
MLHLDVYKRTDQLGAWRVVADNGHTIATDDGRGYENRDDCEQMARGIISGYYRPRRLGAPVNTSQHVDVVIAHGEPATTPTEATDVAPPPEWRIVLLARTKQEGMAEATRRGFTPAASSHREHSRTTHHRRRGRRLHRTH